MMFSLGSSGSAVTVQIRIHLELGGAVWNADEICDPLRIVSGLSDLGAQHRHCRPGALGHLRYLLLHAIRLALTDESAADRTQNN